MDIGDPSEIPSTRKRLPSMQELGAFDVPAAAPPARVMPAPSPAPAGATATTKPAATTTPATAPAPAPAPAPAAAAAPASSSAAAPRAAPTPEQLRQALAKADPQTRQKLLRLISGGKSVQQVGSPASGGPRRRSLVMQADPAPRHTAAEPAGAPPSASSAWSTGRPLPPPPPPPPRTTAGRPSGDRPLMQIDANTELLDAAVPPRSAAERKAELQAQLDQVQQQTAPPAADKASADGLAHKVLFPAYDPARHGGDVHGRSRRRAEGPVEGHFPAPRQPFQASYRHPDGRPMTPEENKVEEVLQAQRCEETLSVLARDGVNGLLLSPRDLDAAVGQGLLTADTAATLWKTWAALRPVIHVIEDEPPDTAAAAVTDAAHAPAPTAEDPAPTRSAADDAPAPPPAAVVERPSPPPPADTPRSPPIAAPAPATAGLPLPEPDPEADPPTLPLPHTATTTSGPIGMPSKAPAAARPSARRLRLRAMVRALAWAFVGYCVFATSLRLALWAWQHWGHLWPVR